MINLHRIFFPLICFVLISTINIHSGTLFGKVQDANTGRPLDACRIKIIPTDTLIFSDSAGHFQLEGLSPGVYRIIFSKPGFEISENTNVVVGTGAAEEVLARMPPRSGKDLLELADKKIQATPNHANTKNNNSAGQFQFGRNDVLRTPGALQDISLFAQGLPGVMRTNDQKTDLSVRGGESNENAYLIDGIPIFNINHFENNGNSGGGIGNINTYFLDNVNFQTGAFSARYPDRLSSVMDISFKRGNSDASSGIAILDAAGMGGLLEGPIPGSGSKGTYGLSMRISSLSMLDNLGLIQFGGVPKYGNGHLKMNYTLSKWELSLNILGGQDKFTSDYPVSKIRFTDRDTTKYASQIIDYQYTDNIFAGFRGSRLFENSRLSLYSALNTRNFRKSKENHLKLLQGGPLALLESQVIEHENSGGNRALLGFDWERFLNPSWTLRVGGLDEYDQPKITKTESSFRKNSIKTDSLTAAKLVLADNYFNLAFYAESEYKRWNWEAIVGLRMLHDEYASSTFLGPRASLSRTIESQAFGNQTFRAAFGLHTQSQAGDLLSRSVPSGTTQLPYNIQTILGWDGSHGHGISTRVELFDKQGYRLLRFRPDKTPRDTGKSFSRGMDIYIRKSLQNHAWGALSYTYSWNRDQSNGNWVPNAFSIPHSMSLALGYELGRSLTTSVHFGIASGAPYSQSSPSEKAWNPTLYPSKHFDEHHDPYLRLDTRIEYRHAFKSATLGTFLEITNITDHENIFTKNEYDFVSGWGFFPVAGITLSF